MVDQLEREESKNEDREWPAQKHRSVTSTPYPTNESTLLPVPQLTKPPLIGGFSRA